MNSIKNFRKVISYLPEGLSDICAKIPSQTARSINEIRLRVNRPLGVSFLGENLFVTPNGSLTDHSSLGVTCTSEHIEKAFGAVCGYSVHSHEKEIARGFITIEGGCRVGICGTAAGGEGTRTIDRISGLNFRIAGQAEGVGEALCIQYFSERPVSMLIVGQPLSGKTTLLKGMCRCLGNRYRVSVIDERSEIAACHEGQPQNDVGMFTDVFDCFDKKNGIETAVRVMSPQIVMCDEIGGEADCRAILGTANSGVKFIAAVHGSCTEEVSRKDGIRQLLDRGIFDYAATLSSPETPGKIISVQRFGGLS